MEITIEEIIAAGVQQEFRQAAEIVFQRLLVEGNAGEPEEVILEIIQIPCDGLAIEAGARIAHFVVQIAARFDLKPRQHGDNFTIGGDGLGSDGRAVTMVREKFKKRGAAKVLFEISAVAQIFGINFRHRQTVPAKMPGKFEEGDILFAHVIENANRAEFVARKPDDLAARTAELALQRLHSLDRGVEMLLKKSFENFHEGDYQRFGCDLASSSQPPLR